MWQYWDEYPKKFYHGQEYAVIEGRLYSRHACERLVPSYLMQAGARETGRGVPPSYVEEVIEYGSSRLQENGNTVYTNGSLKVVLNDFGAVVTIMD